MAIIDTRQPTGKMDFDTEDRLLPINHYRYAKNGRSGTSDKDGDGSVENIRGNVLRNSSFFLSGQVIGSCNDVKNNAIIDFIAGRNYTLLFSTATVQSVTSPNAVLLIVNPSAYLLRVGTRITAAQGSGLFSAEITSIAANFYTVTILSGTPTVNPIVSITVNTSNYIRRWYPSTNTFENLTNPLLMSTALGFSFNSRIYNAKVIDSSFGQLLTWVEYPNGVPRLMNIDRMKQGGEYYNSANSEDYISLLKRPNIFKPTITYINVSSETQVKSKGFQFATILVYDDGQQSVLSPYSDIAFVPLEGNAIRVGFNTGGATVRKVRLLVRQGNGVSETGTVNPQWYEIYEASGFAPNTNITYDFTNTEARIAVARVLTDKIQESVPEFANCIETTDTNQIILADITEGKNNPIIPNNNTGITFSVDEPDTTIQQSLIFSSSSNNITQVVTTGTTTVFNPVFATPSVLIVGSISSNKYAFTNEAPLSGLIVINVNALINLTFPGTTLANSVTLNIYKNATAIKTVTLGGSNSYSFVNQDVRTFAEQNDEFYYTFTLFLSPASPPPNVNVTFAMTQASMEAYIYSNAGKTFKERSNVELGIAYYDKDKKTGGVIPISDITIPSIPSVDVPDGGSSFLLGLIPTRWIRATINNRPPIWAHYYSIVVKETPYDYGWLTIKSRTYSQGRTELVYESLPQDFTPIKGDLARLIGARSGLTTYLPYPQKKYNVLQVDSLDLSSKKIIINGFWDIPDNTDIVLEVYRNKVPTDFYYEQEIHTIGNAGTATRFHNGNVQNQNPTATIPALTQVFGDSWLRFFGQYIVYSKSYNQSYESNYWDKGRPLIKIDGMAEKRYPTLIRWGNKLIDNTQVNNLSEWDEGNFAQVNARFSNITGLRQIGYTLKIIQWANYNTAFVGRREVQNADGSTQLVVTADNLIGTINPSEMEFGTKYPGSILSTGKRVYFFDSLKSKYIVDDGNGLNEIALYQGADGTPTTTMNKYWRGIADMINSSSNYEIITGFDYLFRDMYVSIINRAENTQQTIYYNEFQNAWKYFVDMERINSSGGEKFLIDFYGSVGQSFVANMQANLFEFNKSNNYGELFKISSTDPIKPLVVETIGMIEPNKVKIFLTHGLHSNVQPELVELRIPSNQMLPNGMYSVLKPANYAYREGVFYADIKRDAYTKGFTTDPIVIRQNIASGRPLRGHVCLVRITFNTNSYVKLFTTSIGMIPSELS